MASAEHAELPAPLPVPAPLSEFGLLCSAPPALPFLPACLPSGEPLPSVPAENSPSPLAAFSPGQHEWSRFLCARCHLGHSKQCHPNELHSFSPHPWHQQESHQELQINTKKNQTQSAKNHHKNLVVLTAALQLEQRLLYTFGVGFCNSLK